MDNSKVTVKKVEGKKPSSRRFLYIALVVLIGLNIYSFFTNDTPKVEPSEVTTPISVKTVKKDYAIGKPVALSVTNNTTKVIGLGYVCPSLPLTPVRVVGTEVSSITPIHDLNCDNKALNGEIVIEPGKSRTVDLRPWTSAYFSELGNYKFIGSFVIEDESVDISTNEFTIKNKGFLSGLWYTYLYRPFYNALVWIITVIPGSSLGLSIILLTLLIRTILFFPSHKALSSQQKMQEMQPLLDKLRKKYKDDQQKLAQETMKLWKEHKVNPMGNCLPLLIQFPILLAMFYVVSGGISPATADALYSFQASFDFGQMDTHFLNILELTEKNFIWLPFLVGGLQFFQMHLTFAGKKVKAASSPLGNSQVIMQYALPAMIAVFTASVPAGVGLYWGTSTLFAILQQLVINKSKDKVGKGTVIDGEILE